MWNAYVYLWRLRGQGNRLYRSASTSPDKYGDFCRNFGDSCPDTSPREYEQALFMLGDYIMNLAEGESPTTIEIIDSTLSHQEQAVQTPANYSMVDIDRIKNMSEVLS